MESKFLNNVGDTIINNDVLREDIFNMIELLYKYLFKELSSDVFEKSINVYENKLDAVLKYNTASINDCELYNDVIKHLHTDNFIGDLKDDNQTTVDVYSKYSSVIQNILYGKSEVKNNLNYTACWLHIYEILISTFEEGHAK